MRIIEKGEISDGSEDPDNWPYQTVLEAIRDGWSVIKFPELALGMDENGSNRDLPGQSFPILTYGRNEADR
jgi:hypothetical protein